MNDVLACYAADGRGGSDVIKNILEHTVRGANDVSAGKHETFTYLFLSLCEKGPY